MNRVREARDEDMMEIFKMGYDVWGDNMPLNEYIDMCRNSGKYKKGKWYVLEAADTNQLLSSLIVYDLDLIENRSTKGIGSIATSKLARRNGYAASLLKEVMHRLEKKENGSSFFLYSDIGEEYYRRLGFISLPAHLQKYKNSICMYYSKKDISIPHDIPDYF